MVGVPKCTSKAAIQVHFAMPPVRHRKKSLNCRWALRCKSATESSMIKLTEEELRSGRFTSLKESIIIAKEKNPLYRKVLETIHERFGEEWPRAEQWWRIVDETLKAETDKAVQVVFDSAPSRQVQAHGRPHSIQMSLRRLRSFSRAGLSYDELGLTRRWMLRLLGYGPPVKCQQCHEHTATVYHAMACEPALTNPDMLLRSSRWREAARTVMELLRSQAPQKLSTSGPRRIINRNHPQARRPAAPIDYGDQGIRRA